MSLAILELTQSLPIISSTALTGITGDSIVVIGDNFKNGILQVSGQNIKDSNDYFNLYGNYRINTSTGINNTLDENSISFIIPTGLSQGTNYNISVFNQAGKSVNDANLRLIARPNISGLDLISGLPDQYIRISGTNFEPFPDFTLIDQSGNRTKPEIISNLYSISEVDITSYGTGYATGDLIIISGIKSLSNETYGILQIVATGISGAAGSVEILNSGVFTIPFSENLSLATSGNSGDGLTFNLIYNNYSSGNFDYLEFKVPYTVKKFQSGLVENLRYKENNGAVFTGFQVLGIPEIYTLSSLSGIVDKDKITISGENLNFVDTVFIGNFSVGFSGINSTSLEFNVDNFSETNFITVSGQYGFATNTSLFNIFYPAIVASGFNPGQDILAGTGAVINFSGKYLQRLNYINLGQPNILKKYISISGSGTLGSFVLPDPIKTTEVFAYSVDFPSSGTLFLAPDTQNKLIIDQRLDLSLLNFNYTSGINAARYLDEIEFYTPSQFTGLGDYGNITNSDIFFLSPTGKTFITGSFNRSGIKINNTAGILRIQTPREVDNPICPIKIRRNKYGDEYILPTNKSINILPTIYDISRINTLSGNVSTTILPGSINEGGVSMGSVDLVTDGLIRVSGINASNATKLVFSGYSGNLNLFGFKEAPKYIVLETISKDKTQIETISGDETGYTVFISQLGGDYTGSGEAFISHPLYATGYGYENYNITNTGVRVYPVSGYRPVDSFIFTSPKVFATVLDEPFEYQIQTNSFATKFEISPTTVYGWGPADWPSGFTGYVFNGVTSDDKIAGIPWWGKKYWIKIKTLNGDRPNEAMVLELAFGVSGRSLAGPGVVYRGDWTTGVRYVGNQLRRDIVRYSADGSNYWYATQTNSGQSLLDAPGALNINWLRFDTEFSAVATKILLAEESNITSSLNIGVFNAKTGVIKSVNDVNFEFGSGFFLGYDTSLGSINPQLPKFRAGNTEEGYIKWDGERLSILGSISGVLTSSKEVKDAKNIVDAEFSVAAGFNNTIPLDSRNSFIFGDKHELKRAEQSAIVGGIKNIITGTESFPSLNSNIAGGEENYILGSFSNIMGGKGNKVQTVSTGTTNITFQSFTTNSENIGTNDVISYNSSFFTNQLAILNSIEKSGEVDPKFFNLNSYEIENSRYKVEIPDILTGNDRNFKINSFVSTFSNNLFSGGYRYQPFGNSQFKTFQSGILSGSNNYRINYPTPFTGVGSSNQRQDIIVLYNLQTQNFYEAIITGVNATGFNLLLGTNLKENISGIFFAGVTGNYTGLGVNSGQILQIGIASPFTGINPGSSNYDPTFNIPLFQSVSNDNTLKVFGRASNILISDQTGDQNFYFSKKLFNTSTGFRVSLSSSISGQAKLTGVKYEYIATNIDLDRQSALTKQGDSIYSKFSDFGFGDIGSSAIGGGTGNLIIGSISYIGAGVANTIVGDYDVIPGGRNNKIIDYDNPDVSLADFSAILGGKNNTISGHVTEGIILGGKNNTIINDNHLINREIDSATIINGENNTISGSYSTIINGQNNTITGDYNYTLGNNIKITGSGCIVVRDLTSGNLQFSTTVDNAMYISYRTIILDINKIPTGSDSVPISGLYRNGTFLQIRLS